MQTFLPYPSFPKSAYVLDYRRLGKQRVEAKQIAQAIKGERLGWRNHPAVKMWEEDLYTLILYGMTMCVEWANRGYEDNLFDWFEREHRNFEGKSFGKKPKWFGDKAFHSSHRAALLAKDYDYYKQFGWKEEPKIDYVWPSPF